MSASGVAGGVPVSPDDFECCTKPASDPLTHYPKHSTADDVYHIDGAWAPAAITAVDKRFTDAELAAEFHRSAMVTGLHGDYAEGFRVDILHRFATLPHHDEGCA